MGTLVAIVAKSVRCAPFATNVPAVLVLSILVTLTTCLQAQQVRTCFAPERPGALTCTAQIVSDVAAAQRLILVQAYGFTSAPIARALVDAHKRGVDVRVILDKSNLKHGYSSTAFLQHMGITPLIDSQHAIAHNKVMVIDAHEVITGSFNFTNAAQEKNAENVVFINDAATARAYAQNWDDHAGHSVPARQLERRAAAVPDDAASPPGTVTGNRRSHVYRWPGCPGFQTIATAARNRIEFPSVHAAQAAGYRPAHNCP